MSERKTVGGIPIECLTGAPAVIWSGWRTMGDREIVREASIKGTHLDLAYKCLAYRRSSTLDQARSYFWMEVEMWVNELLQKRQIYRASHILKNMEQNPSAYIFTICTKSKEPSFRNYLANYISSTGGFDNMHTEAWTVMKVISQYDEKYMLQDSLACKLCIEDLINLPENVKLALCTELYFRTMESSLVKIMQNLVLWDYLLVNNKIEEIQLWIDTQCNKSLTAEPNETNSGLKSLFANLNITSEMIELIESSNASSLIKELTQNCLCKYGIFTKRERQDLKLTLARMFSSKITLKAFQAILSYETCNIEKTEFLENVDKTLCALQKDDKQEINLKEIELYRSINDMCNRSDECLDTLIDGIFKTIYYLSNDVSEFLKQNNEICFALIWLYFRKTYPTFSFTSEQTVSLIKEDKFKAIFTNNCDLQIGTNIISQEILQDTLKSNPLLYRIVQKEIKQNDVTMYELLNGYKNINVERLFKWRYNNETMPDFSDEHLIKTYGYNEKLTYTYYLKEARPNMAVHVFKHDLSKSLGSTFPRMKSKAATYAHHFALKHLDQSEILCSCISFIEILGINSENLRLHITVADYVQKELNVSIGHLLESVMCRNQDDLKNVMVYLENSFQSFLNEKLFNDATRFIDALKTWDIIVRFARTHDYCLPDTLLNFLAHQNLWFEFILVGHIFSYPLKQISVNVQKFRNPNIREHLLTCLANTEFTELNLYHENKLTMQELQSSCSKFGLKENEFSTQHSPLLSNDSIDSNVHTTVEEEISPNYKTHLIDNDLWLTILKCHQSQDPPGALLNASRITMRPVLILLATCYEPSSTAAYCYSWMVISASNEEILSDFAECLEQLIWPANKVSELVEKMTLLGYISTIQRAFQIFMPENICNTFFQFLLQCVNYGEFQECQKHLLDFKSHCSTLKSNRIVNWECTDSAYLQNLYWIAIVAVKCVVVTLAYNFQSTQTQINFLNALIKCNFHVDLPVETPNFQCLMEVTKVLLKTKVKFNFSAYTSINNTYNFDSEIQRCITDLINDEDYNSALEVCIIAGVNSSNVVLEQYRNKFKSYTDKNDIVKVTFWKECIDNFRKHNVTPEQTTEFLVEHAAKAASHKERYEILKFAFQTLKSNQAERITIVRLEVAMWKSCILAGPDNINLECGDETFNKLKTELLGGLNELQITCTLDDKNEENAVAILIDKLLDLCKLDIALRISTIFNYKHRDLQVLMLCLSLAENEILPTELNTVQRNLLVECDKNKQQIHSILRNRSFLRSSPSTSSLNVINGDYSMTNDVQNVTTEQLQKECILILETLLMSLQHGIAICSRIVLCYKLAVKLGKNYQFLLTLNNPVQFLQEVTESDIEDKLETAREIIMAYNIKNDCVATFLVQNIVTNLKITTEHGYQDSISLWGYPLDVNFHLIMELCSDSTLLGLQLLKTSQKLIGKSFSDEKSVSVFKTIVELLIRAHDCFTASCNMEGIASVLRKCQNLANTLQNLKYWALLVRLVTGVGRFTEMSYIFQILIENDQFESLLGKSMHKIHGLKTALLEFLRRHCPENKDLFTLVALHFRLYYEIAQMWENEAKDIIKILISESIKEYGKISASSQFDTKLIKNENVLKKLHLAITNFTHATEYYLQDSKLHLANQCCNQAQLIALQISLFASVSSNQYVICILNMKSEEVDKVLCESLNFPQALIVTRAYNHHADWANIIYSHYILKGDTKYFNEFISVNELSSNVVQDCACRYRLEKSITQSMTNNMKRLTTELRDIQCKYIIASQLGFKEIVEDMLSNSLIVAYLKDTIWKKGYNTL